MTEATKAENLPGLACTMCVGGGQGAASLFEVV